MFFSDSQSVAGRARLQQRSLMRHFFSMVYSDAGGRSASGTSPAVGSVTQMGLGVTMPVDPVHPSKTTCAGTGGGGDGAGESMTGQLHAVHPTGASQHAHVTISLNWQSVLVAPTNEL